MNPQPKVKICCIASLAEAELALYHGAAALGLVSAMPSGPGVIAETLIAAIAGSVPKSAETFLLTSLRTAAELIEQHRRCATTTLQLVDQVALDELRILRRALPRTRLVQVIHVRNEDSIREAVEVSPFVDALLLDSGNPSLQVKELGGTGRTHDWNLSRLIRDAIPIPLWLAGGLHPGNVAEAVGAVAPYGLDICSGLRTGGQLDPVKLAAFFKALPE